MAEFPSPSPASIDRDFQHLQLTDSEVLDADPVKEVQADPTEGDRRRTLWDDVENWLRRGVMQQRAKEIREQHRCIGQGILIPRTCTGKQSQSPCHAASCQTCVDLNYALYLTQGLSQAPDSVETNCSRRIATNLSIIQSSSRNGCQKCAIIYNGIKKLFMTAAPLENAISTETHPEVEIGLWYRKSVEVKFLGFHLEFYSEHGCSKPFEAFGAATTMPSKLSPEDGADFIARKLAMCRKQHSCGHYRHSYGQRTGSSRLPKRVLDLSDTRGSQYIKVIETGNESDGEYVTLSHCWGQPATVLETKSSNLKDRLHGIKFSDLPQTFRDAVKLTGNLGIRYLWIDSLCIVQDDRLDWEIESSKMADIYANCTLCISATASTDSNGGCLFDRWTRHFNVPMAALEILSPASTVPHVLVRPVPKAAHTAFFPGDKEDYSKPALLKRAWVFQERILSPRTIHFHEEEMVWVCCTSTTCECGFLSWYENDNNYQMDAWKSFFARLFYNSPKSRSPLNIWLDVIEEFSGLLITYETDRLPALAGLASRLSEIIKSDYVAGFWKSDLVTSIAWAREVSLNVPDYHPSIRHLGPSSIPSWSWASIRSESGYPPEVIRFPLRLNPQYFNADKNLEVLDARCTASGKNKFGNVSGGFIRIRGTLLRGVELSHKHVKGDTHWVLFGGDDASFVLDVSCKISEPGVLEPVCCLLLGNTAATPWGDKHSFALVLCEVGKDTFERIGLLTIKASKRWFDSSTVETITLV